LILDSARWLCRTAAPALMAVAVLVLPACGGERQADPAPAQAARAISAADDAGDTVRLAVPARRIISLAPSATETLVAIGARGQLAGRTEYDVGLGVDALPSVGGGLDPSLEKILALRPDLVIGWHAAGANPVRDRLRELGIPFFAVRTTDTTDVFRTIGRLGVLSGRTREADSASAAVRGELDGLRASVAGRPARSTFIVVGDEPLMTAGPWTATIQLMEVAGGRTTFPDAKGQPQYVSMEELVRRQPEVILLPVSGDGAARIRELSTKPGWRELNAFRTGRVHALPVEQVYLMGPGIAQTARLFRDAIHPELAGR
jgi:ABC-type Fe3+-hydroxamate transport system substrate-binding protein